MAPIVSPATSSCRGKGYSLRCDDAIAYIANEVYTEPTQKVQIVSTDRDFLQLVNNRISVWSPIKKKMYNELLSDKINIYG